jgi:hypothetical protein
LKYLEAGKDLAVDSFGVGNEAGCLFGAGFEQIEQTESDFDIGFRQLNANPVIRGRSITAGHKGTIAAYRFPCGCGS